MEDLELYFKNKKELIDSRIEELIPSEGSPHDDLFKAARYSIFSGGKRMRPILTLATVELLKGNESFALSPAAALEMIHTYSMIHDDLPCMDNDDFRRGKPTLHKVFPEGVAVLAGDYLLTHAFQVLSEAQGLSDSQKVSLIGVLAASSGGSGMIGGQIMDIGSEGKELQLETLQTIHEKKTGALLSASVEFGAILANAPDGARQVLRDYGMRIGLAFQIIDDVLDVTASESKHGKSISSDAINRKTTYATLLGEKKASDKAVSLVKEANSSLRKLPYKTTLLEKISDYIIFRKM